MWIEDPDGIRIVLVEVPADHLFVVTRDRLHHQDDDRYAALCGCSLGGESLPRRRESRHAVPLL
jgi:hypothetical protein